MNPRSAGARQLLMLVAVISFVVGAVLGFVDGASTRVISLCLFGGLASVALAMT